MPKTAEIEYFKSIGPAGLEFTLQKPFADRLNAGVLLHNLAAIFTLIANSYGEQSIKIIDIGCGSGWTSYYLAKAGHNVVGVDISKDAIKAAQKRFGDELGNLTYQACDYENLPAKYSDYDVAIFFDSLHHADNEAAAIKSTFRVLKQGGICIICEPGKGHSQATDAKNAIKSYGVNENDIVPKKIVKIGKAVGFSKTKVFAHPALIHKAIYKDYGSRSFKARLLRNRTLRSLLAFYDITIKKAQEGLVVLYK